MAQLHFLAQDRQNEMQHDLFGHVMLLVLVLVSHYVYGIVNDTIVFYRLR